MREFRQLGIDTIHESPDNPRRTFTQERLEELAASIRQHGVLKPILVRPNGDDGFVLIDGARRLRAARLAKCREIPARVRDVNEETASEEALIANLHHEDVSALDEANSYQRLLDKGRTVDDLAARLGKPKRYIYQVLTLNRLIPSVQDLLARDLLPLQYALKLATIPIERQTEGLEHCFAPLFRGESERQREHLQPLAQLNDWLAKEVRLDPRSQDTNVLLPELAEQVVAAEQERHASVLAVSTLHFHTDKTDPKPILAKSWKPADGKDRCPHARPAVIVLGEGQGAFLNVCIAKKACQKHWGKPNSKSIPTEAEIDQEAARKRRDAAFAREQAEQERWRKELRPRAAQLLADAAVKIGWSQKLMTALLTELSVDDLFSTVVGKPHTVPARRYPQAVAVAIVLRHGWQREEFVRMAKRLGVRLNAKALANGSDGNSCESSTPTSHDSAD